jgi:hypothetical protein
MKIMKVKHENNGEMLQLKAGIEIMAWRRNEKRNGNVSKAYIWRRIEAIMLSSMAKSIIS